MAGALLGVVDDGGEIAVHGRPGPRRRRPVYGRCEERMSEGDHTVRADRDQAYFLGWCERSDVDGFRVGMRKRRGAQQRMTCRGWKRRDPIRRQQAESRARKRLGVPRTAVEDSDLERIEQLADFRPVRAAVQEALSRLPPALSSAVVLRVANDLPYPDVAQRLGCSEKAARVRVSRALRRLGELLEGL